VLEQNYPNPFNPITRIAFEVRAPAEVALEIVDLRGRRVVSSRQDYPAGRHEFVWNGTDQAGRPVSSGVYLYTVRAGDVESTRKMLMTR
jgi:flagellar hook assembly protein FlgD